MRKLIVAAIAAGTFAGAAAPALAVNDPHGQKVTVQTTLDACGYFVGTSTANKTTQAGDSYTDKGTWTGVENNYYYTPVSSLGTVTGSYTDSYNEDSSGNITNGSEMFRSGDGTITQSYSYSTVTGWDVTVTATGDLSFLTSSTSGDCYSGPFPRS